LAALCRIWQWLAWRLRGAGVAHCDLQHGNVLLVPATAGQTLSVKLVDYDGMCVPALAAKPPGETGHPAYQHPMRVHQGAYGMEVDRFSHLVIFTALRSLMVGGKALWDRYNNGDNLLFCPGDFERPEQSPLLEELQGINDAQVSKLASALSEAVHLPLERVPLLEELVGSP
jgi:hypothetical protein